MYGLKGALDGRPAHVNQWFAASMSNLSQALQYDHRELVTLARQVTRLVVFAQAQEYIFRVNPPFHVSANLR